MKTRILLLTFLFIAISATSQWSTSPNQNLQIRDTVGEQVLSKSAIDSQGNTYLTWFSTYSNWQFNVYIQKLDVNGNKLWGEGGLLISDNPSDTWITDYDMCLDNNENVIVSFQDIRKGSSNIFAYKISPSGDFLWGQDGIQISDMGGFNPSPILLVTSNNDVLVTWANEPADTTENSELYVKSLSSSGEIQWTTVCADTSMDYMIPHIADIGNDDFIISWMTKNNLPDTVIGQLNYLHVFAQKFNNDGTPFWENIIQIDSGLLMTYLSLYPSAYPVNDDSGGAFIVWQSFFPVETGGMPTTYVNHIDSDGNIWKPNGYSVSNLTRNYQAEADQVYLNDSENLLVCWKEFHYDAVNMIDCWGIRAQKFDKMGNKIWSDTGMVIVPLNCAIDTTYNGIHVDKVGENDALIVYDKDFFSIDGADTLYRSSIYATRIDIDGNPVWEPEMVPMSVTASNKYQGSLSNMGNEQWVLSWNDNISSPEQLEGYGIYAQNITADGNLGPLGIITKTNSTDILIYPNPATDYLVVTAENSQIKNARIDIFDISGRNVITGIAESNGINSFKTRIDISNLENGTYILRLAGNCSSFYKHFIVN